MTETNAEPEVRRRRRKLEHNLGSWVPMGLAARFDEAVQRYAERPFVITDSRSWSYAEVQAWSRQLARGLYELGVRPGDRVAMLIDNRPEFVAVKLAIARIGAVAVPVNFAYRAQELATVLATSGASVLISIDESIGVDHVADLDQLIPGWESGATSERLPRLRHVLLVEASSRHGAPDLTTLTERGERVAHEVVLDAETDVDPDSLCDVVFTSGTSGHPLGAMLTHDMVTRSGYGSAYHRAFDADGGWRICFSLPMYHVFGYIEGLVAAIFAGGAIVPHQVFNPRSMLSAIERHRVSEVLFVPTMSVAVVDEAARHDYDTSSLESVFSAAAPAPIRLWDEIGKRLRPRQIFTGYGQTEVSAATTLTLPGDPVELVSGTVGRTKLGGLAAADDAHDGALAQYRTVDPFTGEVLPDGAEGELAVRGPIVTRGYWDDPERTSELIDSAGGWLRTGDLGRVRPDGYLELTGRSSELFKVGGELVAPKQVEEVLTAHPAVAQAYVAGVPDQRLGEVGHAWVVREEGSSVTEADLLRHFRESLAGFKVPRRAVFLDADQLPTTSTGKVQKYRLVATVAAVGMQ
jgi:fatty-acyl-CoA synthase